MSDQSQPQPGTVLAPTGMEVPPGSAEYIARAEAQSLAFANPKTWGQIKIMAETFYLSKALPSSMDNAAKVIMALQAGFECGLKPIEALSSFYFVNGKLALYGEMAIAMVQRAGHIVEWGECDDQTATCIITRGDNGKSMKGTFTMAMAEKRGLATKDTYKKYPENMLKFKAFNMIGKFIVPDAFHGVPIKEEMEDMVVVKAEQAGPTADMPHPGMYIPDEDAPDRPLGEALKGPRKAPEAEDASKAKIGRKKGKDAAVDAQLEAPKEESDDERAARLTELEINGKQLEPGDKMWLARFETMKGQGHGTT